MKTALEYMADLHPSLANDYKTPNGQFSESCGAIAVNLAQKLLKEGKAPFIMEIHGKPIDEINRELIIPKPYNGRIKWGAHQICCVDNLVYDPMISSKPVTLDEYFQTAFMDEIEMEVSMTRDRVKKCIH